VKEKTDFVDIELDLGPLEAIQKVIASAGSAQIGVLDSAGEKGGAAYVASCHEFGAHPRVTDKMRSFFFHKFGVRLKASTTQLTIPERSFLRLTMSTRAKEFEQFLADQKAAIFERLQKGEWELLFDKFGAKWVSFVHEAFTSQGFGTWTGLSKLTKANRKGGSGVPLMYTGALRQSVTHEVSDERV
jgi:hypothetical protein